MEEEEYTEEAELAQCQFRNVQPERGSFAQQHILFSCFPSLSVVISSHLFLPFCHYLSFDLRVANEDVRLGSSTIEIFSRLGFVLFSNMWKAEPRGRQRAVAESIGLFPVLLSSFDE